jgi:hypothetical protein
MQKMQSNKPCNNWAAGNCTYGAKCKFSHDGGGAQQNPVGGGVGMGGASQGGMGGGSNYGGGGFKSGGGYNKGGGGGFPNQNFQNNTNTGGGGMGGGMGGGYQNQNQNNYQNTNTGGGNFPGKKKELQFCDHFRQGRCTKPDCRFVHEFSNDCDVELDTEASLGQLGYEVVTDFDVTGTTIFFSYSSQLAIIDGQQQKLIPCDGKVSKFKFASVGNNNMIIIAYANKKGTGYGLSVHFFPNVEQKQLVNDSIHQAEITGIEIIPEPFNIISCSRDGYLRMSTINAKNELEIVSNSLLPSPCETLTICGGGLIIGCGNGTVSLFHWSASKAMWDNVSSVEGHSANVMAITDVGPIVYSTGADGVVNIMLHTQGADAEISSIARLGLEGPGTSSAYSAASKTLIFGLADGTLQFINKEGFVAKAVVKKNKKQIKKILSVEDTANKCTNVMIIDAGGYFTKFRLLHPDLAAKKKEEYLNGKQQGGQPQMYGGGMGMGMGLGGNMMMQ